MPILKILLLAIVQGLAELLPVSSSAHVVVAERLLGLDPSSPQMTLVLVLLHTGTMLAVIVYFWRRWRRTYFSSVTAFQRIAIRILWATLLTGILGEILIKVIEKTAFPGASKGEIEMLFGRLDLIAPALFAAGVLILIAGLRERAPVAADREDFRTSVTMRQAGWMGLVQGLCLPFRGFSRSGATISTGMLAGAQRERVESFSFALAVVLTPAALAREALRLVHAAGSATAACPVDLHGSVLAGMLGMVLSFLAGVVALRWLSSWLDHGRWWIFGVYCLLARVRGVVPPPA